MPEGTTAPRYADARLPQRFWDKVRVDPDGCWRWTRFTWRGYGRFSHEGKVVDAHGVSYRTLIGPIAPGLVIDHVCHDPRSCAGGSSCPHRCCVNPAHMEIKTHAENTSSSRMSSRNSKKTVCPHGHPYTAENTRIDRAGRRCLTCYPQSERMTHCRRGHEYTPENTRQYANGRICKACESVRKREKREEYRAANPIVPITHCIHGHEFTAENTRFKANGTRRCNACDRERMRATRKRKREQG